MMVQMEMLMAMMMLVLALILFPQIAARGVEARRMRPSLPTVADTIATTVVAIAAIAVTVTKADMVKGVEKRMKSRRPPTRCT